MSSLFYKCKQRLLRLFSDLFPVRFLSYPEIALKYFSVSLLKFVILELFCLIKVLNFLSLIYLKQNCSELK